MIGFFSKYKPLEFKLQILTKHKICFMNHKCMGQFFIYLFILLSSNSCRKENPNLVSAYNKYKNASFKKGKGFEIFSVSLDNNATKWKNAIKKDKLSWKYHVSDLKGWNSEAAKTYKVRSIPQSYLINPEGIIIAKNLRGMRLHTTLDKYVKSF